MSNKSCKLKMTEKLLKILSEKDGLGKAIDKQLLLLSLFAFIISNFSWAVWLRDLAKARPVESYFWFCLFPLGGQLFCLGANILFRKLFEKYADRKKISVTEDTCLCVISSFFVCSFFYSIIFFHRDILIFILLMTCPVIMACVYESLKWLISTLFMSLLAVAHLSIKMGIRPAFHLDEQPVSMRIFFTLCISVLIGYIIIVIYYYINQIRVEKSRAEATETAKSAFFASMSREIRNPINAILGMSEMILREEGLPKEMDDYAVSIRDAGENLLTIVNDIMDSAKLDAGRFEMVEVDYDFAGVISDCYNLVNLRTKEKGLELKIENNPELPRELHGDEVRLRQIISNVLLNSIKHTSSGFVELNVDYRYSSADKIDLIIEIKDSSIGLSKEDIDHMLEPEYMSHNENGYINGLGLGLSVTAEMIKVMGGTFTVKSVNNEGVLYSLTLPQKVSGTAMLGNFKPCSFARSSAAKYEVKFQAPEATILVVDDVQMNLDVFTGLLKRTKVNIETALSGNKALEMIREKKYDIIFLDHIMPEPDGIETLAIMNMTEHLNKDTPVIVITANVGDDAEVKYKEAGFDGFITKPVKGKVLEEMVFKYLKAGTMMLNEPINPGITVNEGDFLKKFAFLDTEMGLICSGGSVSLYKNILEDFVIEDRTDNLKDAYSKQDWEEYRILAHSVKSGALTIGAVELSEEARSMEINAIKRDTDGILKGHNKFLKTYESMIEKVKNSLE